MLGNRCITELIFQLLSLFSAEVLRVLFISLLNFAYNKLLLNSPYYIATVFLKASISA